MSSSFSVVASYPPELLYAICSSVYSSALPAPRSSLDPLFVADYGAPTALPSSLPSGNWPEPLARQTLASLCLVNKAFYEAAKPWLWKRVEIRLPRSWLAFLEMVVEQDASDDDEAKVTEKVSATISQATSQVLATSSSLQDEETVKRLNESVIASLSSAPPSSAIPPELLSPPASRDPSPARLRARAKSPGRWRLMRAIGNALQDAMTSNSPGVYVPTPIDPRPGRHIEHLDFNHFRTIGMRRSGVEGASSRFVTSERLEQVLKEMPKLLAFGATEYMDGALTLPVLTDLLFRGKHVQRLGRTRSGLPGPVSSEISEDDWERRQECLALQALDFCGCVSAVFVDALSHFVESYLGGDIEAQEDRRGRRHNPTDTVSFPEVRRLGLRGTTSLPATLITPFVLAFPHLTHLDLSGTRCGPELLFALGNSSTLNLKSLALSRIPSLTGASVESLLVYGRATAQLTELSLYGDMTFPSPLSEAELRNVVVSAPCFRSGKLEYLDISSAPLTAEILKVFPAQPALRSLGLSHIPDLALADVSTFVLKNAPGLEVLTLVSTSQDLTGNGLARRIPLFLHQHIITPLCTPPFQFSLTGTEPPLPPPTQLRVVELSLSALTALGNGSGSWRVIRSKGGRGWYIDTASGWCAAREEAVGLGANKPVLRRDLDEKHPLRFELNRLADANGNVGSGIGWHGRKMEILHGQGMQGREDGLYGAVSFAYHN
ncbi:hypothetical protein SISSUDRAFT_350885 [Sistotremastrum suecicum HHB10207 ss-3]|uniref:RNI-like protein n=1 Tax=Sistotremastrum suecicum HHB10207 ss-3 TaxID=1314776 RepID=A0A166G2U5_9AGAM|nr:hypothetical protein SISSUDRAFT_350885 [Sistotremastrum suecicum HHB10207 ss-3]